MATKFYKVCDLCSRQVNPHDYQEAKMGTLDGAVIDVCLRCIVTLCHALNFGLVVENKELFVKADHEWKIHNEC